MGGSGSRVLRSLPIFIYFSLSPCSNPGGCFLKKQLVISPVIFKPSFVNIAVLNKFTFDGRFQGIKQMMIPTFHETLEAQTNKMGDRLFLPCTSD